MVHSLHNNAIDELLDSLWANSQELIAELDRLVPEQEQVITPTEAIDDLTEAILAGKTLPANHPRRIIEMLKRMVKGDLTFDDP